MFLIRFLSMSYCFFVYLLFREFLQFYTSLMLVKLNQTRGTVAVFNNCNLPPRKSYDLYMIATRFVIYIIIAQNAPLFHLSLFKNLYFYIHHVWVYFIPNTPWTSATVRHAPVAFPVDNFTEIASSVPNYASPAYPGHIDFTPVIFRKLLVPIKLEYFHQGPRSSD